MIKLVAVDMDGTFLKSDMTYDRERFAKLYGQMKEAGIRFVVASGNQYYQLRSFFPQAEELTFVAENGGFVKHQEEELFVGDIPLEVVNSVLEVLSQTEGVETILCGKDSAYLDTDSVPFFEHASRYYHRLKKVASLAELPEDVFIKFAIQVDVDKAEKVLAELTEVLDGQMIPVSSGHGDIDLILPGVNKAHGLAILGEKFDILPEEMIGFGDSGNDKEMLEYAGFGFAMANAQPAIKSIATKTISSNNDSGVLETLEDFAANQWLYPY